MAPTNKKLCTHNKRTVHFSSFVRTNISHWISNKMYTIAVSHLKDSTKSLPWENQQRWTTTTKKIEMKMKPTNLFVCWLACNLYRFDAKWKIKCALFRFRRLSDTLAHYIGTIDIHTIRERNGENVFICRCVNYVDSVRYKVCAMWQWQLCIEIDIDSVQTCSKSHHSNQEPIGNPSRKKRNEWKLFGPWALDIQMNVVKILVSEFISFFSLF